jgi:hypothetical protein
MLHAPALLLGALLFFQEGADTLPLFSSHEPLHLTFVADFEAIRRDRSRDPQDRPALVVLESGDTVRAELRPRGHSRRDPRICSFPPLRLDVKRGSARGTVFEGQDKLKVVVPCRPERPGYEELVLREYLLYRVYAITAGVAYRVRLASVTFEDQDDPDSTTTRWVYLIESDEELAARFHGQVVEVPPGKGVLPTTLHAPASAHVAAFQYMIGNTDWEDAGVHNMTILALPGRVVPVPYDFDLAGAVEAPYAAPAEGLPISTVRQRYYRGWCRPELDAEAVLRVFREARPEIEALYRDFPHISDTTREETLAYFAQFFDHIETVEVAQRRLFRDCRKAG